MRDSLLHGTILVPSDSVTTLYIGLLTHIEITYTDALVFLIKFCHVHIQWKNPPVGSQLTKFSSHSFFHEDKDPLNPLHAHILLRLMFVQADELRGLQLQYRIKWSDYSWRHASQV